jgi:hypothetical protein
MLGPSLHKTALKILLRELLKIASALASIYSDLISLLAKEQNGELKKEIQKIQNSTIQLLTQLHNLIKSTSDEILTLGG